MASPAGIAPPPSPVITGRVLWRTRARARRRTHAHVNQRYSSQPLRPTHPQAASLRSSRPPELSEFPTARFHTAIFDVLGVS